VVTVGTISGWLSGRRLGLLGVRQGPTHFAPLTELWAAGEVRVHVDRIFGLDAVPDALRRVGEGLALGKVVVEIT
jgi:NADPH:quinone reductase-like Zn-dependent oxidoreductase